jgi:hypothetical protein
VGPGLEGGEVMPWVGLGVCRSAVCCESEKSDDEDGGKARQKWEGGNSQVRPSARCEVDYWVPHAISECDGWSREKTDCVSQASEQWARTIRRVIQRRAERGHLWRLDERFENSQPFVEVGTFSPNAG